MEDSCLQRQPAQPKVASGISIFLLEELGDARLRCAQLKKYIDEAVQLIEKSEHRDHFFEVAGHLMYGIPDTLLRMDKALGAAAMAAAKLDYEETKEELRPEKVDELEKALEEVRVRRVRRQSKEARESFSPGNARDAFQRVVLPYLQHETLDALEQAVTDMMIEFARMRAGNPTSLTTKLDRFKPSSDESPDWIDQVEEVMEAWFSMMKRSLNVRHAAEMTMKIPEAIAQLEHLAAGIESTGAVDTTTLATLIAQLEGPSRKTAASKVEMAGVLRGLSASLLDTTDPEQRPSRLTLASTLRRVFGDSVDLTTVVKTAAEAKTSDDDKQSRFEEGKPADPTENMDADDAKTWKQKTDEHKDKFKAAASGDPRWIHAKYPGKTQDGKAFKKGDLVLYWPNDRSFMVGDKAEAAWRKFESEVADEDVYNATMTASDNEEKRSRFEEGKPADPTEHMDADDAQAWKENTDEHKDKFKAASVDPWKIVATGPSTSNWKELKGLVLAGSMKHWTWEGDGVAFIVTEIGGTGGTTFLTYPEPKEAPTGLKGLYQLRMDATIDGHETGLLQLKRPHQFKDKDDAFKAAATWYKTIKKWNDNPGAGGGIDLTHDWKKSSR